MMNDEQLARIPFIVHHSSFIIHRSSFIVHHSVITTGCPDWRLPGFTITGSPDFKPDNTSTQSGVRPPSVIGVSTPLPPCARITLSIPANVTMALAGTASAGVLSAETISARANEPGRRWPLL